MYVTNTDWSLTASLIALHSTRTHGHFPPRSHSTAVSLPRTHFVTQAPFVIAMSANVWRATHCHWAHSYFNVEQITSSYIKKTSLKNRQSKQKYRELLLLGWFTSRVVSLVWSGRSLTGTLQVVASSNMHHCEYLVWVLHTKFKWWNHNCPCVLSVGVDV